LKLEADTHCHTIASGHAYSTVVENAKVAREKGLKLIAITDHGPSLPGGPHLYHFGNLKVLPRVIENVYILRGVEANILDYEGRLDLPERYLKDLDIVLAGFHTYCYPGGSVEENTKALINAMQNPYVDIIVHPGNPEFLIDIDKFVEAAAEYDVAIEINNSSFTVSRRGSEENCLQIAKKAKEVGAKIAVGSDAHICFDVGFFDKALMVIKESGIEEQNILNVSYLKLIDYLKEKGRDFSFVKEF